MANVCCVIEHVVTAGAVTYYYDYEGACAKRCKAAIWSASPITAAASSAAARS